MSPKEEKPSAQHFTEFVDQMYASLDELVTKLPEGFSQGTKDIFDFRRSITRESDRGAVLMAAAFIDDRLKALLQYKLVDDTKLCKRALEFNGPLGTFSSRIDFCYLLGLLPKNAQRELHLIRKIRNNFAHVAGPMDLEHESVRDICSQLIFHGQSNLVDAGNKFRRSVMALLMFILEAKQETDHIGTHPDFEIPDRTEVYETVSEAFKKFAPGHEYPLPPPANTNNDAQS